VLCDSCSSRPQDPRLTLSFSDSVAERPRGGAHRHTWPIVERARGWRGFGLTVLVSLLAVGLSACGGRAATPSGGGAVAGRRATGALTLIDGKSTTLAAFRGAPVLVWFVENGCASCAASIPAVAKHLPEFSHTRTRVLVLGVYGAFGQGQPARAQLASFGRSTAGPAFADAAWTWGVASAALTTAYDPGGVPDEYFLLDRAGRTVYQGSVPVSTIGALLTHLKSVPS
jgi:hypothetical protein